MPFRNEAASIDEVLASIAAQDVPRARLRLVAVDSGSTDTSADRVRVWMRRIGIDGEIVRLSRPGIPAALNAGIARARADEAVVRLDAHTVYASDFLSTLIGALDDAPPDVWWVGGRPTAFVCAAKGATLVRALMTNPVGLGGAAWRHANGVRAVQSAYLGIFRPGVLQRLGGFDEAWTANEDAELAARLHEAGGRVLCAPARCSYKITRGPGGTLRQWMRYGYWRAHTMLRHPRTIRPRQLAPPAAIALGGAIALTPFRPVLALAAAAFATLVVRFREAGEPAGVTAASIAYFPLTHAAFACGLAAGAIHALLHRTAFARAAAPRTVPALVVVGAAPPARVPAIYGELAPAAELVELEAQAAVTAR